MRRGLVQDSTIYGLGAMLSRALGLILLPIYTRYLDVADYGALALLNVILQNVVFVCLLGVSTAAMRFFFDSGTDMAQRQAIYGTATTVLLLFPPLVLLLFGPIVWFLIDTWVPSLQFFPYVFVVLLIGLFSPVAKLMVGLLRVSRRAWTFVLFHLAFFLFQTGTIVIAVMYLDLGLFGQVTAQLLANAVFAIVAVRLLWAYARPTWSAPIARRLLAYGVPLVPFFIFQWINEAAGRFLLEQFTGLHQVGIFALAAQMAGIVALAAGALDNVMLPHFLEHAGHPDSGRRLGSLVLRYITVLGIVGLVVLVVANPLIQIMATEDYFEARQYVPLLVMATWMSIIRTPVIWSLNHSRRSATLSALNGAAAGVLIGLLLLFFDVFELGIVAVAYAMIGANAFGIIVGYSLAQRHFRLRPSPLRTVATAATLIGGGGLIAALSAAGLDWFMLCVQAIIMVATALLAMRLARIGNPLKALTASNAS
jgi:O-antigen/teichoic acid export membrane protein